jgi:hypothetical protein
MGRHHYQYIAHTLKKIRTYPGCNEAVDKLLAEFRLKYKMRKAIMEELRRCSVQRGYGKGLGMWGWELHNREGSGMWAANK